jgi:hypothetical protein
MRLLHVFQCLIWCTAIMWWAALVFTVAFITYRLGWSAWPIWVWAALLSVLEIRDSRRYLR